jgi:CTP:molybdopterin cytidylyltransferase MocA
MVSMSDRPLSTLQIVVLAAGLSTRFGRPKLLERIHGTSLIRRTLSVLSKLTPQRIIVVLPPRAARIRAELRGCRVTLIENPGRADGLSTSVVLGVRKTHYRSATLFLPADLAELDPRDISRLISRWRGARRHVVARGLAGRASTPLILPKFLYPQAQRIVGDIGLRELLGKMPVEKRTLLDLPSAIRDIDTLEDLSAARRSWASIYPGDRVER